ncbi:MAG: T9SS type A sorting domain-containing protein [Paludibacteraceae bacterium]|nr:T9SS type A sorting domain-containing protein [Paludibacteraceae bacterium]
MRKILFSLAIILLSSLQIIAQSVIINESAGWLESAYVKWQPVSGADSYNVYYSGMGKTNVKIDTQLIRSYGSYFRADIPGLQAGTYTIEVAPVTAGIEGEATSTAVLTVLAHDRTGFAFANGRIPGAYNADGTPKTGAVVLYITQNTKNTVSLNVTGANANPCVGLQAIFDGFKKGDDNRPLIIRLVGQITDLDFMYKGDIVIENNNNALSYITLEGVGDDAVVDGWGIRVKNATNIEIRNLGTMNCNSDEGDNIGMQQNNDHIWVHNCDFFYGNAGSDADQIKGDGALDNKGSTYCTYAYNHFWDSGKSSLLGLSEDTTIGLYVTYHHNWFDHSDSRHPRVRFYSTHVYNNYYDGIAKYGVGSTMGSSVFVENNYFRNCKYPMLTSMQGTDVYNGSTGTFSGEDGGTIKAYNNIINGALRFVPYDAINYPVEFDAYVATTRDETIPSSITSKQGANIYNNFDTDPALYVKDLLPDSPEEAKDKAMVYSGRVLGGDFKWTFNNAVDDASSDVIIPLKTALTNYTTAMVYVQGEAVASSQTLTSTTKNNQTVADGTAIEDMIFIWGGEASDVTVTGLPASGIDYVKDYTAKTITISGIPTANVSFSITTTGAAGTPATESGSITIAGSTPDDEIHNFTLSGLSSTFYTFGSTANLSTSKGTIEYEGLTLTQCLKIESATVITYTTTQASTLTLVMNTTIDDPTARIVVDGTTYVDASGIITIPVPAGVHTITRNIAANLFYMKTSYAIMGIEDLKAPELRLYPNPVSRNLSVSTLAKIEKVEIYNLVGALVKSVDSDFETIDMTSLRSGIYVIKVFTEQGAFGRKIIKK